MELYDFSSAKGCAGLDVEAVGLKAGRILYHYDVFVRDEKGTLICKADIEYDRLRELEY